MRNEALPAPITIAARACTTSGAPVVSTSATSSRLRSAPSPARGLEPAEVDQPLQPAARAAAANVAAARRSFSAKSPLAPRPMECTR